MEKTDKQERREERRARKIKANSRANAESEVERRVRARVMRFMSFVSLPYYVCNGDLRFVTVVRLQTRSMTLAMA